MFVLKKIKKSLVLLEVFSKYCRISKQNIYRLQNFLVAFRTSLRLTRNKIHATRIDYQTLPQYFNKRLRYLRKEIRKHI